MKLFPRCRDGEIATASLLLRLLAPGLWSTTAYALLLSGAAAEIDLIDKDQALAELQVHDLRDAELYSRTPRVFASVLPDCGSAVVVIITAGLHQSSITSSQSDSCDAGVADSCSLGALRIGLRKPSINSPDPLCSTSYRSVSGNAT